MERRRLRAGALIDFIKSFKEAKTQRATPFSWLSIGKIYFQVAWLKTVRRKFRHYIFYGMHACIKRLDWANCSNSPESHVCVCVCAPARDE